MEEVVLRVYNRYKYKVGIKYKFVDWLNECVVYRVCLVNVG